MLAVALAKPSNLLILDEPTNDLDLETLDLLQEMLGEYKGTILLVSHDRDFIDRVATSSLAFEGGGHWIEYAGGYTDMLAQRGEALAEVKPKTPARATALPPTAAVTPTKISFKELHELKLLPAEIETLQAEIAKHESILEEPGLYTRNQRKFQAANAGLAAAQAALEAAEARWLELEMRRETVGG